ncbi:MAG: 50S ribosomal protein L15e [Nitrososphaerota archaeon]
MGLYSLLNQAWRRWPEELRAILRERKVLWRRQPSVVRVEKPLRIDRARSIGYKAKQGFVVLRVKVRRGGFSKPRPNSGRRPKALGTILHKVNVTMLEEAINRARKKYPNLYPLGGYPLAYDSVYKWFEVIMVDPYHPAIRSDPEIQLPDPMVRRVEKKLKRE